MNAAQYLDLVFLGITVAGIGMLGFLVYFNNRVNPVNRAFLAFAVVSIVWGVLNFFSYQATDPVLSLWMWRSVIFSAVWFCFSIYHISYIFPDHLDPLPRWYTRLLIPLVSCSSLLTLTSFVFQGLAHAPIAGTVPEIVNGPLIPIFGFTVAGLVVGAVYNFMTNMRRSALRVRDQFLPILLGTFVTFTLLIVFNYILPTVYKNYFYIPFGAVFIVPFIAAVGFAIVRYRLFSVRIIATEAFAFLLVMVSVLQIFFSASIFEIVFRASIFVLIFIFAILLVNGTVLELKQREEIQRLADNLRDANTKLKELDVLKSQFLSIATHELRTPITIVRNFVSLMLDGTYGKVPPAAEEAARQVFERASDMARSVDSYLNVSRIEQGKMLYTFATVDITRLTKLAVDGMKANADKKSLTLSLTVKPGAESMQANADGPKISEVLVNLIDNSIKYTPKGSVAVTVEKIGKVGRVTIKDTGVGMSQKTMQGLFKLFSPGEDAKKVNVSSTGIGMYVSKTHVEAHKGTLNGYSEGEGKGSQFVLDLPLLS